MPQKKRKLNEQPKKTTVKAKTQCKACPEMFSNLKNHLRQNDSCREIYGTEFDEMMKPKKRDRYDYRKEYYQKNSTKENKQSAEYKKKKLPRN